MDFHLCATNRVARTNYGTSAAGLPKIHTSVWSISQQPQWINRALCDAQKCWCSSHKTVMQSPSQKRRGTIEDEASGLRMPVDRAVRCAFRFSREGDRSCGARAMQAGRGTDVRSHRRHDLDQPVALWRNACRSQLAHRRRMPRRAPQIWATVIAKSVDVFR